MSDAVKRPKIKACPRCQKRAGWSEVTAQEAGPFRAVKQCGWCGYIDDAKPEEASDEVPVVR